MPFADSSDIAPGNTLHADDCVVGAGPAGLAVAQALAESGRDVLLLDAGGGPQDDLHVDVDEIEWTGARPGDQFPLHHRRFGGTRWYGRCVTFDAIDFQERPWVPGARWPMSRDDVASRYDRAAAFLGLARPAALYPDFWAGDPAVQAIQGGGLVPSLHLVTRASDLGGRYRREVERSPRLRSILRATVLAIEVDRASRAVTRLRVAGSDNREFSVNAGRHVLACGALENTRLLLNLSACQPGLFGPSAEMIGRGYMNHVRSEGVGKLRLNADHPDYRALFRRLTLQYAQRSRCWMQLAANIGQDTQQREGLLQASAFFYGASSPRMAALKAEMSGMMGASTPRRPTWRGARQLAAGVPLLARAGVARLSARPFEIDHLVMVEQIEQSLDRESRVQLGGQRDRFGRAQLSVHWRVGPDTARTQRRLHELLAERVRTLGIGTLESRLLNDPQFEAPFTDARHPMGSTRMSRDPRDGVVDRDLRVHALENLYVAGSSVFPTGGCASPTLTIVALALRLADHLRASAR